MPVAPGATETLSGGSGITVAAFVSRVLRDRFEDWFTERAVGSLDGAGVTDNLLVKPGAKKRFQVGGWIDYVTDGSFENLLIEEILNDTTLVLRRAYRGSTVAAHAADAEFRYMGRIDPNTIANEIEEAIDKFWPDIFEVRHVAWTVPASPVDFWWTLPADVEKVLQLYQQTTGSVTDLAPVGFSGVHQLDSTFISTKKAVKAFGVGTSAPDNKLHGVYIARCDRSRLTTQQVALLTYEVAMASMTGEFTGESKPERRSGLEGAPDSGTAMRMWALHADEMRKREAKRLAEYMPRRDRITFRGLRHYSDDANFNTPNHPVRSW